jgi:spoIIIJ-associated protein
MIKRYSGKNLDDALAHAAKEKGVQVSELTYYVVEEKKGILGFGAEVTLEAYALNDVSLFIKTYLENFFSHFDKEAEIGVDRQGEVFKILINASNNAILIGKAGQTLQSLVSVVRSATSSEFKRRFVINVDINNYKVDRYEKVRLMAARIAKQVQRTRITATLDPMPNDERKVIHQELQKVRNIKTESEGEGPKRRLKIMFDKQKN